MGYLELPHLFDGCIRGKLYDEALNLLEFSNEVGQAFEQHQLHLIHHIVRTSLIRGLHERYQNDNLGE